MQLITLSTPFWLMRSLLVNILMDVASELDKVKILNMDEARLGEHIHKSLKGRRYLIVMDDIWSSDPWDEIRRYLPNNRNGSRILFTSQIKAVAYPNSIVYTLPCLSSDRCWELLEKVFHGETCPPQLQDIGKEVANCSGLPLAFFVIAGILSTMSKEERIWKNVSTSLATYLFSGGNGSVMQILEVSYKHLPNYLKPCFLYFGLFPEDSEIPARKLMRLWVAEGFIPKEEFKNIDDAAAEYLKEQQSISRS